MVTNDQYQKEKSNIIDTRLFLIDEAYKGWNRGELTDSEIEEIFFELKVCDADIERINDYSDELQKIYDNDKKIKVIDEILASLASYPTVDPNEKLAIERLNIGLKELLISRLTAVKEREIRSCFIDEIEYKSPNTISTFEKESIKTCIGDLKRASFYARLAEMERGMRDVKESDRTMQAIDRIKHEDRLRPFIKDNKNVKVKDYVDAEKKFVSCLIDRDADRILRNSNNVRLACDFFIRQQKLADKFIDDGDYGFTYDDVVFLSEQYYHPVKYPAPLSEDIKSKYLEPDLEKIQ